MKLKATPVTIDSTEWWTTHRDKQSGMHTSAKTTSQNYNLPKDQFTWVGEE